MLPIFAASFPRANEDTERGGLLREGVAPPRVGVAPTGGGGTKQLSTPGDILPLSDDVGDAGGGGVVLELVGVARGCGEGVPESRDEAAVVTGSPGISEGGRLPRPPEGGVK